MKRNLCSISTVHVQTAVIIASWHQHGFHAKPNWIPRYWRLVQGASLLYCRDETE